MSRIGVKGFHHSDFQAGLNLKKDFLFFDKILVNKDSCISAVYSADVLDKIDEASCKLFLEELEYAVKYGIVEGGTDQPSHFHLNDPDFLRFNAYLFKKYPYAFFGNREDDSKEVSYRKWVESTLMKEEMQNGSVRHLCSYKNSTGINSFVPFNLEKEYGWQKEKSPADLYKEDVFVPIISNFTFNGKSDKKTEIFSMVLNNLIVPEESTSWEQILEMKSDSDLKRKLYALTNWINIKNKSDLSISEIHDEYLYLYHEYIAQFNLHKAKYNFSTVEIVINSVADMVGNLVAASLSCFTPTPIPFSNVTKPLFDIKRQKLQLLENELKLEGKEIAFIHTVNKRLNT